MAEFCGPDVSSTLSERNMSSSALLNRKGISPSPFIML
jgi:hypothetical protein